MNGGADAVSNNETPNESDAAMSPGSGGQPMAGSVDAGSRNTSGGSVAPNDPPRAVGPKLNVLGEPNVWRDITPPVPKPWADGSKFFYGFAFIDGAKADAPGTLYALLDHDLDENSGVWKTTDGGDSWKLTNQGPNNVLRQHPQPLAVDPTDSNVLYVGSTKTGLGLFKSTDGGESWTDKSIITQGLEQAMYWLDIDRNNHKHLLLTFSGLGYPWTSGNAGLLESFDGGATWPNIIQPAAWTGGGQFAFFLGEKNDRSKDTDGTFWLVATQRDGLWRTENSGKAWTQVAKFNMPHGMEQMYRTPSGALYMGAVGAVHRSLDNGRTWSDTGAPSSGDGYGGLVGDDKQIWGMLANTGSGAFGPYTWQTLPIDDTSSSPQAPKWRAFGTTKYANGPGHMVYDPVNRLVYAACWGTGVMRIKLP